MDEFDVIVIGSGPGGYVAAIRAAQLGLRTACVEKESTLGGTCLNIGCIPSKALLTSTEKLVHARHHLDQHGIKIGEVGVDLTAMMTRKDKVVKDNTAGIEYLFRKHNVTRIKGTGRIRDPESLQVATEQETVTAKKAIIIATGSQSASLPGVEIDEKDILSSTGALSLSEVPPRMAVIGAGYIGLEMGSVWARLGSQVTVIEVLDRILPGMDREVGKQMLRILQRQGLQCHLATKLVQVEKQETLRLSLESQNSNIPSTLEVDKLLMAVGRLPYTQGLGLQEAGVKQNDKQQIITDSHFRTNVSGIYAIGDAIAGPMLAHKAEEEGVVCAEIIAGQSGHINYDAIPSVVYTSPEIAQVGRTEDSLTQEGIKYKVGKFPFTANGRARTLATTDGFVKLLADARTDRLLGAHIIGPDAGHLIAEIALAMEFHASAEDIARTSHAHPTLSEAIKEAALAVDKRPIHV